MLHHQQAGIALNNEIATGSCQNDIQKQKDGFNTVKRHHHRHNIKARYELIQNLGKGTYGKVKLAIDKSTGQKVAVKTIRKDKVRERDDMKHILREMEIMSTLRHPHIVQVYEVFENQDRIVIVMEYAPGGELFDYLAEKKSISEKEARALFKQIVSAVEYCHQNGIVHRDLKLENILLGEDYEIKIADFGLANKYSSGNLLNTFCGSPLYASPEIINGIPYTGPEVDSWSLGVLLYALVHCMMPFDGSDYNTLTRQISQGEFSKPTKQSDALDLISQLLKVDPKERLAVQDISSHWWMKLDSVHPVSPINPQKLDANGNILTAHEKEDSKTDAFDVFIGNEQWHQDIDNALMNNNNNPPKKSILKRKDSEQTTDSDSSILSPMMPLEFNSARKPVIPEDVFNCGLQAKDSLKLKAKPPGTSHKRRVMRTKRDRESGYYSSPERNHEGSNPSTPQTPSIKPVLAPQSVLRHNNSTRKNSLKKKQIKTVANNLPAVPAHNSSNFDEMLENFNTTMENSFKSANLELPVTEPVLNPNVHEITFPPDDEILQYRPTTLPIAVPQPSMLRNRGNNAPEALTPTSANLVAELEKILPHRSSTQHRNNELYFTNNNHDSPRYETNYHGNYLDSNNDDNKFSSELDAMMRQLNLELEKAYENAININDSQAAV